MEKLLALQRAGEDPQLRNRLSEEAQTYIDDVDLEYLQKNIPQAIDRALGGLKRVAEIVRSLKAFSNLDQKEKTEAQLDQIADTALTLAANEYKYVAEVVRDYGDLPTVRCHVGRISQVILNIVINAAHAISHKIKDKPELGRITISTRDEGNYAVTASAIWAEVCPNISARRSSLPSSPRSQ